MDRTERGRIQLLVVEDDAAMRDFVSESLAEEGYRVDVAAGGRAGIARAKQGGIDLVITDVKMPDMDGLDLLAEIRASDAPEGPPHVIVVTAFGSIETAKRALKLGSLCINMRSSVAFHRGEVPFVRPEVFGGALLLRPPVRAVRINSRFRYGTTGPLWSHYCPPAGW